MAACRSKARRGRVERGAPARKSQTQPKFVLVAVHELSRHATPDEAKVEMAQYEATDQTTYYVAKVP